MSSERISAKGGTCMHCRLTLRRPRILFPFIVLAMLLLAALPGAAFAKPSSGSQGFYQKTNLVSDIAGAAVTDPNLVNSWGLVHGPTTPWWVADNGTGVSTLYTGQGMKVPLTVTIPVPVGSPAGTTAAPTGVIFNGNGGFNVSENGQSFSSLFQPVEKPFHKTHQ